uniref:Immunoglobulin V-set domain-containing protein n=1 Tax=Oreochromis niloticus TaxID=8128 RepID=A0A669EDM0_ORENI
STSSIFVNIFFPLLLSSLQLECDKREITAHVGGEFILKCKYSINNFLYSKKYWCRGPSRGNCEIVADSENSRNTHRSQVIDLNRRGLFVKVTNLRFDDAGAYWVGIDKIYADIMIQVKVIITEGKNKRPYHRSLCLVLMFWCNVLALMWFCSLCDHFLVCVFFNLE